METCDRSPNSEEAIERKKKWKCCFGKFVPVTWEPTVESHLEAPFTFSLSLSVFFFYRLFLCACVNCLTVSLNPWIDVSVSLAPVLWGWQLLFWWAVWTDATDSESNRCWLSLHAMSKTLCIIESEGVFFFFVCLDVFLCEVMLLGNGMMHQTAHSRSWREWYISCCTVLLCKRRNISWNEVFGILGNSNFSEFRKSSQSQGRINDKHR